jgi:DNA-directed RNA polymerase subunit RPC12/RpoP
MEGSRVRTSEESQQLGNCYVCQAGADYVCIDCGKPICLYHQKGSDSSPRCPSCYDKHYVVRRDRE